MNGDNITMPLQPIKNGRFVPNRIVERLLEAAVIDLNDIARMDFTAQERMQFAQLIGYSLSGFSELSYVDDETYQAACSMLENGGTEEQARIEALRAQLNEARNGIRTAAVALFGIHPDDLREV